MDKWIEANRKLIDKIKAGGYEAAYQHHTKGMLAAECSLVAAYELAMEASGGDMYAKDAMHAAIIRQALYDLKAYHAQADINASTIMGTPVARDGSR